MRMRRLGRLGWPLSKSTRQEPHHHLQRVINPASGHFRWIRILNYFFFKVSDPEPEIRIRIKTKMIRIQT